jgi:hypothetical protein
MSVFKVSLNRMGGSRILRKPWSVGCQEPGEDEGYGGREVDLAGYEGYDDDQDEDVVHRIKLAKTRSHGSSTILKAHGIKAMLRTIPYSGPEKADGLISRSALR